MKIEKIADCEVFSSDFNHNTLIYTEKDGSITISENRKHECDSVRKYVKFYPPDCLVFTTTSIAGLSIWDAEHAEILYKYKEELLYDHSYSDNCILASFDDSNVKFYDLKSRYRINSKKHIDTEKIEWNKECLYCLGRNKLAVFDYRNIENILFTIENVSDFTICNDRLYYLSSDNKKAVLSSCKFDGSNNLEKMGKIVPYRKIKSTCEKDVLICKLENGFRFEKFDSFRDVSLDGIKPIDFHFSKTKGYVVSNDALYKCDGDIDDLFK